MGLTLSLHLVIVAQLVCIVHDIVNRHKPKH